MPHEESTQTSRGSAAPWHGVVLAYDKVAPQEAALCANGSLGKLLAAHTVEALIEEAELTPKPALVDRRGAGAHHDLSLRLLHRSARALHPYFEQMAIAAQQQQPGLALRERLGALGRDAELAMLAVTGGVNTHRGAIWALGLLVAASAQLPAASEAVICRRAGALASMSDIGAPRSRSNGEEARHSYGALGARGEAAASFPHLLDVGLPALRAARANGKTEDHARLDALLAIMSTLDDTCLLHRAGPQALHVAQQGARRSLQLGGAATKPGLAALHELDQALLRLWASPGGSADMLAATLFLDKTCCPRQISQEPLN